MSLSSKNLQLCGCCCATSTRGTGSTACIARKDRKEGSGAAEPEKCVHRRSLNATERCVAAFQKVRLLPLQKKMPDAKKTTKKAAADYMTEPHDPRDSISSQASTRSPPSRATDQPPPPGRPKAVIRLKSSSFSREILIFPETKKNKVDFKRFV